MDKPSEPKPAAPEQEMRYLVRVANTDIKGERKLHHGLCSIKGVSFMFANMVCQLTKLDHNLKIGFLTDAQVDLLEKTITDPVSHGGPVWMLNRRNDYETGEDKHLLGGSLKFTKEQDIKRLQKIRAYRGYRHAAKLPSRGQRTKSNFRRSKSRGKGGLGVKRKGTKGGGGGSKPASKPAGGSKGGKKK